MLSTPDPSFANAFVLVLLIVLCVAPFLVFYFLWSVRRDLSRIAAALESSPRLDSYQSAPTPTNRNDDVAQGPRRVALSAFGR